jgi:hypothetical protein
MNDFPDSTTAFGFHNNCFQRFIQEFEILDKIKGEKTGVVEFDLPLHPPEGYTEDDMKIIFHSFRQKGYGFAVTKPWEKKTFSCTIDFRPFRVRGKYDWVSPTLPQPFFDMEA